MNKYLFTKNWLFFISFIFLSLAYFLWQSWPSLIISSMHWQRDINERLIELLYEAQSQLIDSTISLVLVAFVYGILHSIGPGHGKLIVTTYLATHPTKIKISLLLTILSAFLQAIIAVVFVSALLFLFDSTMREVSSDANHLITLSFYSIVILGGLIIWRNTSALFKEIFLYSRSASPSLKITAIRPLNSIKKQSKTKIDACGCGHAHFADAEAINKASSIKEYIVIILSIGFRPCTGAILVLLFSNTLDLYWLGIISAFFMAIGTALTTSSIAIMTIIGSKVVQGYLNFNGQHVQSNKRKAIHTFVKLSVGVLLVLMGVILLQSQPVSMISTF